GRVALEGAARAGGRGLARARAVAGAGCRERRSGTAPVHTLGARDVVATLASAVARPVVAAARSPHVRTLRQRVLPGGDVRARSRAALERARAAGAGAGGAAADALLAVAGATLGRRPARRAERLEPAAHRRAHVAGGAVGVRAACREAAASGSAHERAARLHGARGASAGAVAAPRQRGGRAHARRHDALGARDVVAALAGPVAEAVVLAARGPRVRALVGRIRPVRDERAGPELAREIAGLTHGRAAGRAADTLFAEVGTTIGGLRARRAEAQLPADRAGADVARRA